MLAKAVTGNSGWDVVFPTHSRLGPMARNGLLAPLDHSQLPLLDKLESRFRTPPWDPALRWGIPYMWSATGIAFNKTQALEPRGWDALWSPALRGRMTMLDDSEDVIGACLLKSGFSFDSTDRRQLEAARAEAIRQKQLLRAYLNAEVRDQLVSGDVLAAQLWSSSTAQAIHSAGATGAKLGFVYPEDGFPLYCDCVCVLRESRRYNLAHEFVNFLLIPEVAASNARFSGSASANGFSETVIEPDPILYPSPAIMRRGTWPNALRSADQQFRDLIWTEIKSS